MNFIVEYLSIQAREGAALRAGYRMAGEHEIMKKLTHLHFRYRNSKDGELGDKVGKLLCPSIAPQIRRSTVRQPPQPVCERYLLGKALSNSE